MNYSYSKSQKIALSICHSFNTKTLLRKKLSEVELYNTANVITSFIQNNESISLVMLWGVGVKTHPGRPEEKAVNQLHKLEKRIKLHWAKGINLDLIYADTHAWMNEIGNSTIETYKKNLKDFIESKVSFLSHMLDLSELLTQYQIVNKNTGETTVQENIEGKDIIMKNAQLHYHGKDKQAGAEKYITTRLKDKKVLDFFYSGFIFLTYNNPTLHFLQPNLPVLYVWATKKGASKGPWFMDTVD